LSFQVISTECPKNYIHLNKVGVVNIHLIVKLSFVFVLSLIIVVVISKLFAVSVKINFFVGIERFRLHNGIAEQLKIIIFKIII
jgi:hypothetical protein